MIEARVALAVAVVARTQTWSGPATMSVRLNSSLEEVVGAIPYFRLRFQTVTVYIKPAVRALHHHGRYTGTTSEA